MSIILDRSESSHTLNFIPKVYAPTGANIFKVVVKNESQNTQVYSQTVSSFTETKYYYQYTASFGFDSAKDQNYTIEITNTATSQVLYRDKIFATDQSAATYSINTNQYTYETSNTNDYLVYE
tara:strand:+ start:6136 stop:6504 length:369 start_codon:yes stop_codon:yes gene_type:complete